MSVASKTNKNPFAILDDDPKEVSASKPVKEVVKKSTSSKKSDVAPPKADSSKATKRSTPGGNEGAFRDKSVGRDANRNRPADAATGSKQSRGRQFDRHSQTGKTDSERRVRKAWGDNRKKLDDEAAGENIAKSDETQDAAEGDEAIIEQPEQDKTKTLEEYFAELNTKSEEVKSNRTSRRHANDGVVDAKWDNANELVRQEEEFIQGTGHKSFKQKNRKEKVVLETDINFAPPQQNRPRPGSRKGGASRGGRHNRSNAPAVNISNTMEFPTLGH